MNKPLHILHLEDEPDFAELVRTLLAQDNVLAEVQCVGDRASFQQAIKAGSYDLIISDFHLPSFTGLEALAICRAESPLTPFILVSGTIGEQAAIESLRAGATDYVLKQQPDRLPSAVRRAVEEAEERSRRHAVELELVRREKYFRALTENSLDIVSIISLEMSFVYVSPSVMRVLNFEPHELLGQNVLQLVHPEDQAAVMNAFQSALEQPTETIDLQCRHRHKDGSWRHLESVGTNHLGDPDIGGVVVASRDITERRQAEEELRRSEKQYRLLFQSNPNPMWVFDLETLMFLEVNEAAIQHYGYSREAFLAMTMEDIRVAGNKDRSQPAAGAAGNGLVWTHRRKNGSLIDVEVIWSPMAFRNRFAALTMATDVTDRRRAEHRDITFAKLSHRLSSATTDTEAAAIICEAADALFKWNDFALDLYSAERDEVFSLLSISTVEGRRVEIPAALQAKGANALIQRAVSRGAELLSARESRDYSTSTMLAPIRKGEKVIGVLFVQNNTPGSYATRDLEMLQNLADQCGGALERVRAEQQSHEHQQRFQDLFENSPDAIFVNDLDGTVLDANVAASMLHGMTRDELVGRNALTELVPASWHEPARRDFGKLASGELSWIESESLKADGSSTPVEVRAKRIEFGGKPALLLHVRDITQRRAAASALQSSEALFRSVWENSVDGMRLTDEHGLIIAVNGAFCRLVGMAATALEGKPFTTIYAATEDLPAMLERHRQYFVTRTIDRKNGTQFTLHNGNEVNLEISDSVLEIHGQPLLCLSLFRDVTTQRRLEAQLRQSQKMEAIGQLAGGVAHDFNNILTVIHGHASLLGMGKLDATAARSAQQIASAAERATSLTRQLLAFSRRQLIQPRRLDMNEIVRNMSDMLGRLLGEDVLLRLNYSSSDAMVEADAGMMEQVLLNLAVNARDAMPRGGQLTITINVVELDAAHVQRHPEARHGSFVCLTESDTGCGIPQENLSRIFEPFFTTKDVGKGTGLGLATVYGIVKQHQGWIEVESQISKGTTFRVYLPHAGASQSVSGKPANQMAVRGGSETILLVEDERPVRELVARVLQKYGYKVIEACSGIDAIGAADEFQGKIDLLLTDLVMPGGINGRELAEKLWSGQPDLKVVFTSGYSSDIVGKDFKINPELNFLQKPYHPQTLAATVRRCLDGRANPVV